MTNRRKQIITDGELLCCLWHRCSQTTTHKDWRNRVGIEGPSTDSAGIDLCLAREIARQVTGQAGKASLAGARSGSADRLNMDRRAGISRHDQRRRSPPVSAHAPPPDRAVQLGQGQVNVARQSRRHV